LGALGAVAVVDRVAIKGLSSDSYRENCVATTATTVRIMGACRPALYIGDRCGLQTLDGDVR
jgi:hypothetical protein